MQSIRSIVVAMVLVGAAAHGMKESGTCYTLRPGNKVSAVHSGGLSCQCPGQKPVTVSLDPKVGKMAVQTGSMRMGGGPLNCYTTSVISPATVLAEPGGTLMAKMVLNCTTIIHRTCDYSECHSILGLFNWGSASCRIRSIEKVPDTPSWMSLGDCDSDPDPTSP